MSNPTAREIVPLVFGLLFVCGTLLKWTGVFDEKSPVPKAVLAEMTAAIESEGKQPANTNIFSLPGSSMTPQVVPPTVTVRKIIYNSHQVSREEIGGIPAGTVYYRYVVNCVTNQEGLDHFSTRLYFVYLDPSGYWKYFGTQISSQ